MQRFLLALLLLAAPAAAQEFATTRPLAVVDGPLITLGDIFAGAGTREAVVVGSSPPPGRRLVVEAAQLQALARHHGLAWRPFTANERCVIERPGRALPQAELLEVLRSALLEAGMAPEAELELAGFTPPMLPATALPQLLVEGLSFDATSGRFTAALVITAAATPSQRLRLAGRALPTQPAMVAARRLALGDVLRAADLRQTRLRADRIRPGTAESPEQVVGQQLRRPLAEGTAVQTADLAPPNVVAKNALVTMLLEAPGLSLAIQGRALADAAQGGLVQVMNLESRAVVEAQATGPGRVRVAMGSVPVLR